MTRLPSAEPGDERGGRAAPHPTTTRLLGCVFLSGMTSAGLAWKHSARGHSASPLLQLYNKNYYNNYGQSTYSGLTAASASNFYYYSYRQIHYRYDHNFYYCYYYYYHYYHYELIFYLNDELIHTIFCKYL